MLQWHSAAAGEAQDNSTFDRRDDELCKAMGALGCKAVRNQFLGEHVLPQVVGCLACRSQPFTGAGRFQRYRRDRTAAPAIGGLYVVRHRQNKCPDSFARIFNRLEAAPDPLGDDATRAVDRFDGKAFFPIRKVVVQRPFGSAAYLDDLVQACRVIPLLFEQGRGRVDDVVASLSHTATSVSVRWRL